MSIVMSTDKETLQSLLKQAKERYPEKNPYRVVVQHLNNVDRMFSKLHSALGGAAKMQRTWKRQATYGVALS